MKKNIYIKTEPGGKILFGRLNDINTNLLLEAIESKELSEELFELRFNRCGTFTEYEGVINNGNDGDLGNEGIIKIDDSRPHIELEKDTNGKLLDGAYLVYLCLSKVSIEFEFEPTDGKFDKNKFYEISKPIDLPEFVEHDLYGNPSYNIVIDYEYDGEYIDDYDRELNDRGYDVLIMFILVKDGVATPVYKNYNDEESWPSE